MLQLWPQSISIRVRTLVRSGLIMSYVRPTKLFKTSPQHLILLLCLYSSMKMWLKIVLLKGKNLHIGWKILKWWFCPHFYFANMFSNAFAVLYCFLLYTCAPRILLLILDCTVCSVSCLFLLLCYSPPHPSLFKGRWPLFWGSVSTGGFCLLARLRPLSPHCLLWVETIGCKSLVV